MVACDSKFERSSSPEMQSRLSEDFTVIALCGMLVVVRGFDFADDFFDTFDADDSLSVMATREFLVEARESPSEGFESGSLTGEALRREAKGRDKDIDLALFFKVSGRLLLPNVCRTFGIDNDRSFCPFLLSSDDFFFEPKCDTQPPMICDIKDEHEYTSMFMSILLE